MGRGRDRHNSALAFTQDFRHEFQRATDLLLRRRFLWFIGTMFTLSTLSLTSLAVFGTQAGASTLAGMFDSNLALAITLIVFTMWFLLYIFAFLYAWFDKPTGATLLRLTMVVVALDGVLNISLRAFESPFGMGMMGFLFTHVIASLFLPWTARQAMVPALIALVVNAFSYVVFEHGMVQESLFLSGLSVLTAIPGTFICWARHSSRVKSYKTRFIAQRYTEVRRELTDARRIHESLFPEPSEVGGVSMRYEYMPMRQIGGDFLFASASPCEDGERERFSFVLLDVTGHGISAALTVNRLHGELERIFAEQPGIGPGEVLSLLNRYVHLTLASHSVYVTAYCARVDPNSSELTYASGGHPPAFLRGVDGTVERLDSTSFVLGACAAEDFDPEPRTLRFGPGDTLIAYTDGATEARDNRGKMLGIDGIHRLIAQVGSPGSDGWPHRVLEAVDVHRHGPPEDDALVVELARSVEG